MRDVIFILTDEDFDALVDQYEKQEVSSEDHEDFEDLYVTTLDSAAKYLLENEKPVLFWEINGRRAPEGVRFVFVTDNEPENEVAGFLQYSKDKISGRLLENGFDRRYFSRIHDRLLGRPWFICETDRCIIRETTEEDVDSFYEIYKDPEITEFTEGLFTDRDQEISYTKDYREKVYSFYEYGIWTVLSKDSGEVIGRAGITNREGFEEPELGFVIGKKWQRQGIATEVCRRIIEYGRDELGFKTLQAFVIRENVASLRLLSKLGFKETGTEILNGTEHIRMKKEL
ncbi:MAG: GNAT family N-acetyltransferase [Lachnospiraceae bacterium]|nr:GNAT family N-acetyltransferase [Lachnospiraceae bacterium]